MRIALLSAEYPPQPGGIGDYTAHLGAALHAAGHQVFVITAQAGHFMTYALHAPAAPPQRAATVLRNPWGWAAWRNVIAALDAIRPDVLHIQYQTGAYGMHPAINLLPWRLRQRRARPALVVTMHDLLLPYLFPKAVPVRRWVTHRLIADADAAIATNDQDAAAMAGHARTMRTIPIGNNIPVAPPAGWNRAAWRATLGVGADETLVAYFGLLSRSKGVDVIMRALALLAADVRLLLIGGEATSPQDQAYAAEIAQLATDLELNGRIIRTGHAAPAEASAHLLAADLAALPFADGASFRRGSLLAALAHGLPVISTATAPPNEPPAALQACALLIPPDDPHALAAAIRRLHSDAALRAALHDAGAALAAQWSWPAIATEHEALYQTILKQPSRR